MRRLLPALLLATLALGGAAAQTAPPGAAAAQREAEAARKKSEQLERAAAEATGEAARARAEAAAVAARIEAAEAAITAAELRIRDIEMLRREQRARLAAGQGSLIRLAAALQTMARRPAALALVQPGSLDQVVHVRALLASTLPVVRARTVAVRAEVERGNRLRAAADQAVRERIAAREDLRRRRLALARLEQRQRARSADLLQSAIVESDRALAFGEEAREIAALAGTREFQASLARRLAALPPPLPRPGDPPAPAPPSRYLLPVDGRLLTGTGEISDAGVHARGLTFAAAAGARVVAPGSGRVAWAGRFRGYGEVVIIDHGGGLTSTLTNLSGLAVARGATVRAGQLLGRTGPEGRVSVELRRGARPLPITLLL